jgi:hypothetical protein
MSDHRMVDNPSAFCGEFFARRKKALIHPVVGMHRVFKLGDVGVLGDVVDRRCRQAQAHLAVSLAIQIYEAMPSVERSNRIIGIVIIKLIESCRICARWFDF